MKIELNLCHVLQPLESAVAVDSIHPALKRRGSSLRNG